MNRLGIIQGRLLPPVHGRIQAFPAERWRDEFALCRQAGLDCIEWIVEKDNAALNPLLTDHGLKEIKSLSRRHGVRVSSVLADYFVEKPLFGVGHQELQETLAMLDRLIFYCAQADIPLIEIPFVDASRLPDVKARQQVTGSLKKPAAAAERAGITIGLETDLSPTVFKEFVLSFDAPNVKVNYDMGNSASLGFDPREEVPCLGPWIANVHVKDRQRGGGTVPLGKGAVDFSTVFRELQRLPYKGDWMIQGARQDLNGGTKDGPAAVSEYLKFIQPFLTSI